MRLSASSGFGWTLASVLSCSFLLRLGYVLAQAATDPTFSQPVTDGAYYLEWARALASGGGGGVEAQGAFYRAPLYAYALRLFIGIFGVNFGLLYYTQQLLIVATAGVLACAGRSLVGPAAGLVAGAAFLLYHPTAFFASRPSAEPLALLLMAISLWVATRSESWAPATAGLLVGVAALARPGLLLLAPLWAAGKAWNGQRGRALLLVGGMALALLPTSIHNYRASGHLVPVSSNAGLTLYHGNGPGADGGGTFPVGFSGGIESQRDESTRLASLRAGRDLDAVEADRWWGRQALRERAAAPLGTAGLLLRRGALLAANAELGLGDGGPALDANPFRWSAPLPFCVLLGLAAAGLFLGGWRGTGGWLVWGMVVAGAATPMIFFVASRYRLALAAALCIPAGVGVVCLTRRLVGFGGSGGGDSRRRAYAALTLGGLVAAASMLVPTGELEARSEALGRVQRAWAWGRLGNLEADESELRRALELDPDSVPALFNLGVVLAATGRPNEAEAAYRRGVELFPGYAPAAGNLGSLLIEGGRTAEAVPILEQALESNPLHRVCWTNLIYGLALIGEVEAAGRRADQAVGLGVPIEPELLGLVERLGLEAREEAQEEGEEEDVEE